MSKYVASGLSREAVSFAVANYGDNPTKVIMNDWCSDILRIWDLI